MKEENNDNMKIDHTETNSNNKPNDISLRTDKSCTKCNSYI